MIALPPFWQLVVLLATHWVGDFVFQTDFQALNKSKRLDVLSLHVATYTATLFVAAAILFGRMLAITFTAVNGALHFTTDYFTSRVASKFWAELGRTELASFLRDDRLRSTDPPSNLGLDAMDNGDAMNELKTGHSP